MNFILYMFVDPTFNNFPTRSNNKIKIILEIKTKESVKKNSRLEKFLKINSHLWSYREFTKSFKDFNSV